MPYAGAIYVTLNIRWNELLFKMPSSLKFSCMCFYLHLIFHRCSKIKLENFIH